MGCDIHIIGQYKDYQDKWIEFILPPLFKNRDYAFFGVLAGFRSGEYEPIASPRAFLGMWGFPYQT